MGARTLGGMPQARLMHHAATGPTPRRMVREYVSSGIPVPRPLTGGKDAVVRCAGCGGQVRLRVLSEGEARRRRLLWAALALVGAVGLVVLVAFAGQGQPLGDALGGGVVLLLAAAGTALLVGAVRWFREDGVAIVESPEPHPDLAILGGEHLLGFPTIGRSTWTRRGRARAGQRAS